MHRPRLAHWPSLCLACALLSVVGVSWGHAAARPAWHGESPCPIHASAWAHRRSRPVPLRPIFALRAPMLATLPADEPELGTSRVGSPLFDSVFSSLRKKNSSIRLSAADDSVDTWRIPRFDQEAQRHAERGYSFVRVLPTACLTAGVLTLSLTIGSQERFVVQAKPGRMGAQIGFRGRFW